MSPLRKRRTNEVSEENPIVEEQAQLDFEGNAENQVAENQESSEVQETATGLRCVQGRYHCQGNQGRS